MENVQQILSASENYGVQKISITFEKFSKWVQTKKDWSFDTPLCMGLEETQTVLKHPPRIPNFQDLSGIDDQKDNLVGKIEQ